MATKKTTAATKTTARETASAKTPATKKPAATKAAKATTAKEPVAAKTVGKKMSQIDAALAVLKKVRKPLPCKEMIEGMAMPGDWRAQRCHGPPWRP